MYDLRGYIIVQKFFLLFLSVIFVCSTCLGQLKRYNSGDSLARPGNLSGAYPKIRKNHFITRYPDEMFFIQCGLQDRAGNMWFGSTGDGIYYYNGKVFFNFTTNDGLCHNDILCCYEDVSGIIWFGTRNGLIMYKPGGKQPQKDNFTSFLISQNTVKAITRAKIPYTYVPADNFVWSIYQDKNNIIWFCTNKGVYICNPAIDINDFGITFTEFVDNSHPVNDSLLLGKEVQGVTQDRNGNMWFTPGGRSDEVIRFDGKTLNSFKPDTSNFKPTYLMSYRSVMGRSNGDLLFLNTVRGVYAYNGTEFSNLSKKAGIGSDTLVSMAEDKNGNLWFGRSSDNIRSGGAGGLWRFDGKSLKLFTIKDGLSHNCVFCIIPDKDGNVWFGTRNTGLCRYDGKTFTDFTE